MSSYLERVAAISTPRPCNCLLASTSLYCKGTPRSYRLKYACYELGSRTEKVGIVVDTQSGKQDSENLSFHDKDHTVDFCQDTQSSTYHGAVGDITIFADRVRGNGNSVSPVVEKQFLYSSFPFGIFDSIWIARKLVAPLLPGETPLNETLYIEGADCSSTSDLDNQIYDTEPFILLAACTDGSARFIDPLTSAIVKTFSSIHNEMLTSCTPFISSEGPPGQLQLLCTAHGGGVVMYDLAQQRRTHTLEGHEFDAWCGAVWPSCVKTSASTPLLDMYGPELLSSSLHGLYSPCIANDAGKHVEGSSLLLSGGDDAVLKFYDLRCSMAYSTVGKMRFEAGVVSISPVLQSVPSGFLNQSKNDNPLSHYQILTGTTPYLLVGSYDESISLIDVRYRKRPIAQRGNLGGGVWRTSRCVIPVRSARRLHLYNDVIDETHANTMVPDPSAARAPRSNYEMFEQNTLPFYVASGEKLKEGNRMNARNSIKTVGTQSYVTQKNVLVLPLMQQGAAFLSYDVMKAEDEVFDVPQYFFMPLSNTEANVKDYEIKTIETKGFKQGQRESTPCRLCKSTVDQCLVYDTAVLGLETGLYELSDKKCKDDEVNPIEPSITTVTVATCSFYEKRIDIWHANKIKLP